MDPMSHLEWHVGFMLPSFVPSRALAPTAYKFPSSYLTAPQRTPHLSSHQPHHNSEMSQ